MVDEPEEILVADEVQEEAEASPAPDSVEELRSSLDQERAAREKAERDLSSLRGQVRSSHDFEDSIRGEIGGIYKYLETIGTRLMDDDNDSSLAQLASERTVADQQRTLTRAYERLAQDLKDTVQGEDDKLLFESLETAPELEEARRLWNAGKGGQNDGRYLTVPERVSLLTQAVAEAAKQARIAERKLHRETAGAEKIRRDEERKKRREESGDLDLDLGSGGMGGRDDSTVTPSERLSRGLKQAAQTGKRSVIFDGS